MKLELINQEDAQFAEKILNSFYADELVPAEKKTYLTDLRNSVGPYLGIATNQGKSHYLLDAASQIATLGHGFNPTTFFGTTEFLESWINTNKTSTIKKIRTAYADFFKRKLGWEKLSMTLTHSGAEANETALGLAFLRRENKKANKVLAFEGSFHGRMMVTLSATWNKSKREPFEWKNFLAEYVKYPELPNGQIHKTIPKNWREVWENSTLADFETPEEWNLDPQIKKEVETLKVVRDRFLSEKFFAILVEPMQCEGGDCYSSDRFHTALLTLAKNFQVATIYDEVQTGFHLGREFFWHRQFNLKDSHELPLFPNYVVCAKKAQLGIVLSHHETKRIFQEEEFSVASFLRGYAHALSLDQVQETIFNLEKEALSRLDKLMQKHSDFISRPRGLGLAFAFDVKDNTTMNKFVALRFKHGLLFYPAGDQTLRFRLSTAFRNKDLDVLFEQLDTICQELFLNESPVPRREVETTHQGPENTYRWHEFLIKIKMAHLQGKRLKKEEILKEANFLLQLSLRDKDGSDSDIDGDDHEQFTIIKIDTHNFLSFRQAIIDLEKRVYEPSRQTDIEKFEHTVLDPHSICLGLVDQQNNLSGMAFAGPLKLYPFERGVRSDPLFNNLEALYMLDVTMGPECQKSNLGRMLKYTLTALAPAFNIKHLQGRNRDRLASNMLNINLSLGAFEQRYIKEDYPDFEPYRDVIYYTSETTWQKPPLKLCQGTSSPFLIQSLNEAWVKKQLPYLINKICLSNFISEDFARLTRDFFQYLPKSLRHGYTTSGQSECVDKLAKSIWVKAAPEIKEKHACKMLTFEDHYFGNGSMLSRSLSLDHAPYFHVTKLAHPTEENQEALLKNIKKELNTGHYLAVWIEPLPQKLLIPTPQSFLVELKKICQDLNVALIYNETASAFYRYDRDHLFASSRPELTPDAGMIYCSGQSGVVFTQRKHFLEQPLMLISTWDGDEFHFMNFMHALEQIEKNKRQYYETISRFEKKLTHELTAHHITDFHIKNGVGLFKGLLPPQLKKYFQKYKDHYLILPSFDAMKEYLDT